MIDHDAYDRAERQRDRQIFEETEARYLARLTGLIEQHGQAYVSSRPTWLVRLFPSGFIARNLPVQRFGEAA